MSESLTPQPPERANLPAVVGETAATAQAAQAKAMVEARYLIAMRQPRDLDLVRQKLLKECRRPGFAEVARYNKPIGKGVVGPSIRFAEAAIRYMCNIDVQVPTIYDDREKRIVRISVVDLETNSGYSTDVAIEKTVERKTPKKGDVVLRSRQNSKDETVYLIEATEDDLLNKQNALISKAMRTNGLRLIPGDIVEECMDLVVETQRKKDAEDPDAAKRKIFDAFGELGVSVDQIKVYLGHSADVLTPKELTDLRGLYSAIKDGETTWLAAMESLNGKPGPAPAAGAPAAQAAPGAPGASRTSQLKSELGGATSAGTATAGTAAAASASRQDATREGR